MSQSSFSLRSRIWYAELFGHVRIDYGTHPVAFRSRAASHLIAYLLAHPRHEESRERILALFWPDARQDDAANNFRVTLSRLRSGMLAYSERIPVEVTPTSVRIDPTPFFCDLTEFDKALAAARAETEVERRVRHLQKAVGYYKDTLMADCDYDWVRQWRNDREDKYLAALGELFEDAVAKGRRADAVGYAHKILAGDPYDERTARWLEEQRHGRPAAHANRTEAQAPVRTEIPIENEDPDHVLLEELGRWLDDTGAQTPFVVELEGQQFHVRYAKAVAMAVAALEQRDRAQDWETSLETHTTCFRIGPDEDKVLTIRPSRGNPCFAPTGNHAPFYHDPDPTDDLAEALAAETYAYRKAVRAVVAAANKAQAKNQDPNHIARNARGQLTNVLAGRYPENATRETGCVVQPQHAPGQSNSGLRDALSCLRGIDQFLTVDFAAFLARIDRDTLILSVKEIAQIRNIGDTSFLRIPPKSRNVAASKNYAAEFAVKRLIEEMLESRAVTTQNLREVIRLSASIGPSDYRMKLTEEQHAIIAGQLINICNHPIENLQIHKIADTLIDHIEISNCSLETLVSYFGNGIYSERWTVSTKRLIETIQAVSSEGEKIGRVLLELRNIRCNCKATMGIDELIQCLDGIQPGRRLYFGLNLALAHAFFSEETNSLILVNYLRNSGSRMREIDRLGFDFVEARIKSQQGEHSSAEKSMLRILDSLQLLDDERIALYMTYHRNRELVHLGKLKEEDSTEYLKRALESGNLRAIIGNLINSILATNASITKGVMIGFLSSKIKELPANVYQQFKDDISDITDFSRWDGILDISLIHLGSRMTDKDMLSYLNAGGFTTPVPSELFDDSDVLNLG